MMAEIIDQYQTQAVKYRILLISNSVFIREDWAKYTFEKSGYVVYTSIDARDAWEKLQQGLECDVIWCCKELPRMDILELFSLLKNNARFKDIPFFALANSSHYGNVIEYNCLVKKIVGKKYFFLKPPLEELVIAATAEAILGFR
jgi:CheY-like chemotaxis protein